MATAISLTSASSSCLHLRFTCQSTLRAWKVSCTPPSIGVKLTARPSLVCHAAAASSAAAPNIAAVDTFLETPYMDDGYEVPVHRVVVHDRQKGVSHTFDVPEDQYILQTGEEEGIELPFACRHGCCTACAVRVKSGSLSQPRALGISPQLKEQGYALLCVGIPKSDLEVETQDEDEVYWLQFGRYFARGAVERDDFALELAVADE